MKKQTCQYCDKNVKVNRKGCLRFHLRGFWRCRGVGFAASFMAIEDAGFLNVILWERVGR